MPIVADSNGLCEASIDLRVRVRASVRVRG